MDKFEIKKAVRANFIPLFAIYGRSGSGKTYSALLQARGIAGPKGKVILIDSENHRGELFADDPIIGGYDHIDLTPPFSSGRYKEAFNLAMSAKPDVVVIDSMSHEWEAEGGVCEVAAENERKGSPGFHNWKAPKVESRKLRLHLTRAGCPVICCLRASYKTTMEKDEKGKNQVFKNDYLSPIQDAEFIYDMSNHIWLDENHIIHVSKPGTKEMNDCYPKNGMMTVEVGANIAKWCKSVGKKVDPLADLKKELLDTAKDVGFVDSKLNGVGLVDAIQAKFIELEWIRPGAKLSALGEVDLGAIIQKLSEYGS